ncbi:MAG TPA: class I SAM-dependent methyltransferase [Solirubrobacteraceae bacterium]|nr:class I SAM-dependent methyltransferase [Solirubrobacteraceae bacterium]
MEFGTSFGISTIYLAAAVRDNGIGSVVTTELSETKVAAARANLVAAGVHHVIEILAGDARETLAGVQGPIQLVLLDGWKYLALPVLRMLEPSLTPGALVLADDTSLPSMADYLVYVRDLRNGYESVEFPVADGVEISCRTACEPSGGGPGVIGERLHTRAPAQL